MSPVSIPWRCAESARRWRPEDRGPRPLAARPPHARPPTPRNRKRSRGCQVQAVTFQIFGRQFLEYFSPNWARNATAHRWTFFANHRRG
jgi:hypothetical protein